MMRLRNPFKSDGGAAAAEMAMVLPFLLVLMFGSAELGNYFLDEHGLVKQVRDGARYAARLPTEANYTCPNTVNPLAQTRVENVVKTGTVDASGEGRFNDAYWTRSCSGAAQAITVSIRCVDKDEYSGIYSSLVGDIPVVKVSAAIGYRSVLGSLGLPTADLCLRAESESPVIGS
jgi:hypothetical protein